MSSIDTSGIDATKPNSGEALTSDVRDNFSAIKTQLGNAGTDIDTNASGLTNHAADTATHGTTGDIVGTSDAQALTNKTLVAASNTITTAASGDLAATELNAALAELESEKSQITYVDSEVDGLNHKSVANKAAAVLITPTANKTLFVGGTDGGLFKAVTGGSGYSDNGGSYCGTQFIPTGGDGSAAWVRVDGGYNVGLGYQVAWYGAAGDGVTDDTVPVQTAVNALVTGKLTAGDNDILLISSAIDIPNRNEVGADAVNGMQHRNYSFNGCKIVQNTDNTPIFTVKSPTTNIRLGDFRAAYTNNQPYTNINAAVVQIRNATVGEDPTSTDGVWDNLFENIFASNAGYPAALISEEDESLTSNQFWGNKINKVYGWASRRAVFSNGGGSGQVANSIHNCLFYGGVETAAGVPFLSLRYWTESSIHQTELLNVTTGTNIVSLDGCTGFTSNQFRLEDCTLNTNGTAYVLATGGNSTYTFNDFTISNSEITSAVTTETYGIYGYSSHIKVNSIAITGTLSLDVNGGNFYLFYNADSGNTVYENNIFSNVLTADPTSNFYLYKFGSYDTLGVNEDLYSYQSVLPGGSGVAAIAGFIDADFDGYIVASQISSDVNITTTIYPKTLIDGVEQYNAGFSSGTKTSIKGFAPLFKGAIPVTKGQRLSMSVDPVSQTNDVSVVFRVLRIKEK